MLILDTTVTGHGDLMLANRLSFEYDLRGPRFVSYPSYLIYACDLESLTCDR